MTETINVDYLVIGAGAMGMAFVDTLLTDTQKTVAIVDRYARPSGHWNVAYPYVRLHQTSAFYGVNSRHLGNDSIDKVGWNKGLYELASRDEVCAYYDTVMNQTFLPSGRVAYYPKHEYAGGRNFHSIMTGKAYEVGPKTRIVDATYMQVKVPSMGPPSYEVAEGVEFVTPNNMASAARPYANYTIIGAGKTGVDACLWLLANGIDPASITWIMPRDSFYLNRSGFQIGEEGAVKSRSMQGEFFECVLAASSIDDLLARLEACQQMLRLDDTVWPTMFRCAIVSLSEFEQLKKIKNIIRQGHVIRLSPNEVQLQNGTYKPNPDTLFVDCSADGLAKLGSTPIFQDDKIRLQPIRMCQQVFSAAFIAHVEATYEDSDTKNKICRPIPHPDSTLDLPLVQLQMILNSLYWNAYPKTLEWLLKARLNWFRSSIPTLPEDPVAAEAILKDVAVKLGGVCAKLKLLLKGLPQEQAAVEFEAIVGGDTLLASN
ncbi:hypothetical protein DHEL01_v206988 [Diaporthe helianthi]|uniref:Pyridine nucleotide-disulfide oxidoreductase n=1 Tax=Diaporthe helianthi TaxID=158607 RepID=A0A2P5HWL3_DIAHE|nr:hypothetical protein DHEL01_v206988 [Diaporthe helianthi]